MIEQLEGRLEFNEKTIDSDNLTSLFDASDLQKIGNWAWEGFVRDKNSRRDWEDRTNAAMDLAMQVQEAKNFPWPNCSNIIFPLVTIASLQFSTKSYANLIRGDQIFKYKAYGEDPKLKQQAGLLGRHLSWQVMEEDQAWEEQQDRIFINCSIVGCTFVKTQFSSQRKHNISRQVMARNLVLDYNASSVEDCQRKSEVISLYRNDIVSKVRRGLYDASVLEESWFNEHAKVGVIEAVNNTEHDKRVGIEQSQGDKDTPFTGLEQHCWMDLDKDGFMEPYIVTLEAGSKKVLRLVARVDREEDVERNRKGEIVEIRATEYYTKVPFIPAPDGGIYDMGFGILLGPLNEAVNTGINQIFDAGTSNMLGGGFVSGAAKLRGGVYTRTPGEWKIVKTMGDDLRKAMVSYPEIPINDTVFKVISLVIQYADRLAGTVEAAVGENPGQNTPAQTYQGMVEQGTQIYKSIFKRVWRSMKEQGKKLHKLNAKFMPESQYFGKRNERITREAYKSSPDLLVPMADPNMVSDQQRIARSSLLRQAAHTSPGYDLEEVEKDWLDALGADAERIYKGAYSQWYQQHPLPNPKVQQEQMKMQGIKLKVDHDKWKTAVQLMADKAEMQARMELLKAQAAKLIAEIGAEKAAHQLEVFESIMEHLRSVSEMMNKRIESMMKGMGEGGEDENQPGGAGRDANDAGGQGAQQLPPPANPGAQGPMGGGAVQQ